VYSYFQLVVFANIKRPLTPCPHIKDQLPTHWTKQQFLASGVSLLDVAAVIRINFRLGCGKQYAMAKHQLEQWFTFKLDKVFQTDCRRRVTHF